MISTDQLRKLIEDKKVTIGTAATTRLLKADGIKRVLVAKNADQVTREAVGRYKAIAPIEVEELPVPNDELGVICKKPFSISIIGIKK
jgi:large subunit ribosomal protein L30e